jgi:hypothetical protein
MADRVGNDSGHELELAQLGSGPRDADLVAENAMRAAHALSTSTAATGSECMLRPCVPSRLPAARL